MDQQYLTVEELAKVLSLGRIRLYLYQGLLIKGVHWVRFGRRAMAKTE